MSTSFVVKAGKEFYMEKDENVFKGIFKQYESVVIESLISSFGLEMLFNATGIGKDKHGGDVDTIHNVREIGVDPTQTYKNPKNAIDYDRNPQYNSNVYHKHKNYQTVGAQAKNKRRAGELKDAYTNKKVARNANIDIDHIIPANEIHNDRGRVLADLCGVDLANSMENIVPTDRSINRSKGARSAEDYISNLNDNAEARRIEVEKLKEKPDLSDKEKRTLSKNQKINEVDPDTMLNLDANARKAYEAKLNKAYYTSRKFVTDFTYAAGIQSAKMGMRQALGFVFAEIWFAIREEFDRLDSEKSLKAFLNNVARGVQKGVENAKGKYREILSKFSEGALSGVLSSLSTTICNIFFTTAKNVVRIIRETYASLVEATKVLLINPDNLPFGNRIKAVAQIIATGASIVVGVLVSEAIENTPIGAIPVLGEIIQAFCGTLCTGVLSCTLLYFMDRSQLINQLVDTLNEIHTIDTEVAYFKEQAAYFERYAAELLDFDIDSFAQQTKQYSKFINLISETESEEELNIILKSALTLNDIKLPWEEGEFDEFMHTEKALVFE